MSFQEMSLTKFSEVLASGAPTPGGGSASALSGALAASLAAMVARTTAANKKFADRADQMNQVATEADRLRGEFLALVDEDARAFDQVMAAFWMPKDTPEQQAGRSEAIQQAYRAAVEPPMRVCARSLRVLELALQVAEQGNPSAASDAGVAALLAATALEGGALNVQINLGSIKDEGFRTPQAEKVRAAQIQGQRLREKALATVRGKLGWRIPRTLEAPLENLRLETNAGLSPASYGKWPEHSPAIPQAWVEGRDPSSDANRAAPENDPHPHYHLLSVPLSGSRDCCVSIRPKAGAGTGVGAPARGTGDGLWKMDATRIPRGTVRESSRGGLPL